MFKRTLLMTSVMVALATVAARADTIIWGNNASLAGTETIEAFDVNTNMEVANFLAPGPNLNGRGLAIVGNTIYYSNSSDDAVYKVNATTHAYIGVAFHTGLPGIANIAWDGTALWVTGYNGSNNAYRYTPSGTLLQTVLGFGNSRDGFEVAGNHLIANEGDGSTTYDLYDLSGTLLTHAFIDAATAPGFTGISTGIAFDGKDYWISNPDGFSGPTTRLLEYSTSGTYMETLVLPGGPVGNPGLRLLEDLSSLGNIPSNTVPEPISLTLFGAGLAGLGAFRRRRKSD